MENGLIGHTGFVGSNLDKTFRPHYKFNSENIESIKGLELGHLIVAGAPGVKWYANKNPGEDLKSIERLIQNLKQVTCQEITLISTVDVYGNANGVCEDDVPEPICKYGAHRLMLEAFILEHFANVLIVRLPALFGAGLRKNVLYDFIHNNNIRKIDSRNEYQFYSIEKLYQDILLARDLGIVTLNITTEPLCVADVYSAYFGSTFHNIVEQIPKKYDVRSRFSEQFGGCDDGYFTTGQQSLTEIISFMKKLNMSDRER